MGRGLITPRHDVVPMRTPLRRRHHACPCAARFPATQNVAWQATYSPGRCGRLSPVPRELTVEQPDNNPAHRKENQNGQV